MKRFPALLLRCLLALVLVTNAAFAPVHAHAMAAQATASSAAGGEMPCHDPVDASMDERQSLPASGDDCCGAQCLCGCLIASALPDIAAFHALDVPPERVASNPEPAGAAALPSRLLRPPIA